jgi:hypothetical protein
MKCLHPHCPMGQGAADWNEVLSKPGLISRTSERSRMLAELQKCGPLGTGIATGVASAIEAINKAAFSRLIEACPCLFSQLETKVTAKGVVHLCEVTLGNPIVSSNVHQAFKIQHPKIPSSPFKFSPVQDGAGGGDIMEALCSEVLSNHGILHMEIDSVTNWPVWASDRHVSLNIGKMRDVKLYGDILIPAAPHNILISVKSEATRERLVVSGNRLDSIGFGFFNEASEFWTVSRMNLLKRWGFLAIYMPSQTLQEIHQHLVSKQLESHAININGRALYRDLSEFGDDISKIAGKLTMNV